ncbi:MAG: hypothetical protein DHS20C18_36200 [Saprospiraceae bacterium]|nr:MAG: hypothetical protein DHS20C18_36200 [Saprospiraceae bacterium]
MKKINTLVFIVCCLLAFSVQAQRYLTPVFTDVDVTQDKTYGVNATVLLLPVFSEAVPRPLVADVYEPQGDNEDARPVVLVFHTGNFLPHPQNGGTGGTLRDSTVVETCTRLAKMGYVAMAIDYRLGWNPIAPTQDERVFTLINAAYRGIQDARTAIRYLKKDVRDNNNQFGIDTSKMVVWGIGTGGYITAGANTLDTYTEILLPKFITTDGMGNPFPMVIEGINGNIYGTSVGIVPPGYPGFPAGDTLCYPNHVTYQDGGLIGSDYQMTVNMGGALGDTSWINPGESPWVSFHSVNDSFAPYVEGTVLVPVLELPVVEVQGSYLAQKLQNELGNNAPFADATFIDAYSAEADLRNDGYEGLYPFLTNEGAPWDFWANDNPNSPGPSPTALARTYFDTIMNYYAPRACLTLDLGCDLSGFIVGTEDVIPVFEVGLQTVPNPATESIMITTNDEYPVLDLQVYDFNGRLMHTFQGIKNNRFELNRGNVPAGMYLLKARFEKGVTTTKIMFK